MASDIPSEILLHILHHCDPVSLCYCRRVCRQWRDSADVLQRLLAPGCDLLHPQELPHGVGQDGLRGQEVGQGGGPAVKTVMKMTLRTSDTEVSEMYPDDAEAGVKLSMETVDWINWKQVFRSWMELS